MDYRLFFDFSDFNSKVLELVEYKLPIFQETWLLVKEA